MWLSKRARPGPAGGTALTGPVTLPGETVGAWLEGERRGVTVYAPGGYHWSPRLGDEILVLKTGERGEKPCAVGVPAAAEGLEPGEVLISSGACVIHLRKDGTVAVTGRLTVNDKEVALKEEES